MAPCITLISEEKMTREELHAHAERLGIPRRTLAQVRDTLAQAKKKNADMACARLMAKHGRLTDEAMAYVEGYLGMTAQSDYRDGWSPCGTTFTNTPVDIKIKMLAAERPDLVGKAMVKFVPIGDGFDRILVRRNDNA